MKVLFAVWELDPLIKVGGLGDVAKSLPAAFSKLGVDIRIVIPYYKAIDLGSQKAIRINTLTTDYAGKKEEIEIYEVKHPLNGVPVYLLKHNKFFSFADFPDTFALFDKAIIEAISGNLLSFIPDIIHCNDLHTGLVPLLIRINKLPVKTLLTIHNLSYQGKTSLDVLAKMGLNKNKFQISDWEIVNRQVNFLLEGIIHADIVTTVSPTYAKEIMTEEFGCGLEEVLRGKEGRVFGILNGIDEEWGNMANAKCIKYPFVTSKNNTSSKTVPVYKWQEGKRRNKLYLQKKMGFVVNDKLPLISYIGRFDPNQKGIDILHKMMRRLVLEKYSFVILGTGDPSWEERFQWLDKFFPKNVAVINKFDNCLADLIYAASDFILVPSKFEPCGLIQMNAMLLGTLPIAHKTGGLVDSIKDDVNGFLFEQYTSEALERTFMKAIDIWQNHKKRYEEMVEEAINTDFSWKKSAGEYLSLYEKLVLGTL